MGNDILRGRTRRLSQPCRSRPGRASGRLRSAGSRPGSPPCGPPRGRRRGRRGRAGHRGEQVADEALAGSGRNEDDCQEPARSTPLTATSFALTITDNRPMSSLVSVIGSAATTRRPLGISIARSRPCAVEGETDDARPPPPADFVLATLTGKATKRRQAHRTLQGVARRAKLIGPGESFRPHDLRSGFAVAALLAGDPPNLVQRMLGHSTS